MCRVVGCKQMLKKLRHGKHNVQNTHCFYAPFTETVKNQKNILASISPIHNMYFDDQRADRCRTMREEDKDEICRMLLEHRNVAVDSEHRIIITLFKSENCMKSENWVSTTLEYKLYCRSPK